MFNVPILLTIHSRPATTRKVLNAIRNIEPKYLYVSADGPRANINTDKKNCAEARSIIDEVDWDCEIETLFRDENLGCRGAMYGAINWFFSRVEYGIVLEDDCVPTKDFFYFCDELLELYKTNEDIYVISGSNYQRSNFIIKDSYYFSRYMHCWGWASWRRAWNYFDNEMSEWPEMRMHNKLDNILDNKHQVRYWKAIFDATHKKEIDSWAYAWMYSCWLNGGSTIVPSVNLVQNIGYGVGATHTKGKQGRIASSSFCLDFPLRHPEKFELNNVADGNTEKIIYSGSLFKCTIRRIKKSLVNVIKKFLV